MKSIGESIKIEISRRKSSEQAETHEDESVIPVLYSLTKYDT